MKSTIRVFLIFFVMIIGMVFSAGCGWTEPPGYHQTNTLILTKFSQNGSIDWSKKFDSLGDVSGYQIIQTPKGNYLLSASVPNPHHFGVYQGQLIGISSEGTVESRDNLSQGRCKYAPFVNSQGEIISIWGNEICRITPEGSLISNFTVPFSSITGMETRDGGYLLLGSTEERPMMTKEEFTAERYGDCVARKSMDRHVH